MKLEKTKLILFGCLIFLSVGCDRVTKELAKEHLAGKGAKSYLNDTFRFQYVENPGAAMSLGAEWAPRVKFWLLNTLPALTLLLMLAFAIKNAAKLGLPQLLALGLIFSGGFGNLFDRFFNNSLVPDFMNMGVNNLRTGIFNVADVCITAGVVMILFFYGRRNSADV